MLNYNANIYENIFLYLNIKELYGFRSLDDNTFEEFKWKYILDHLDTLANINNYYLIKIDKQTTYPIIINDYYNVSYQQLTKHKFSEIVTIEKKELDKNYTYQEKVFTIMDKLSNNYNIIDDLSNYYIYIQKNILNPIFYNTNIMNYQTINRSSSHLSSLTK